MTEHHTTSPADTSTVSRRATVKAAWAAPVIAAAVAAPVASASGTVDPPLGWDLGVCLFYYDLQIKNYSGIAIPAGQVITLTNVKYVSGMASGRKFNLSFEKQGNGYYTVIVTTLVDIAPFGEIRVPIPCGTGSITATFTGPDTADLSQKNNVTFWRR